MTSDQVFSYFGGKAACATALGIQTPSVYAWRTYPPPLRQLQVEKLTAGKLKAERDCDKFRVTA